MTTAAIVGIKFRPPAPLVLSQLGMDEPLALEREPENPHDPNAIKVMLPAGWAERHPELFQEAVEACQAEDREPPVADQSFHLGYIPRGIAEKWAPIFDREGSVPSAKLVFAANGGPICQLLIEEKEEEEGA